jgi:hypothetical protein
MAVCSGWPAHPVPPGRQHAQQCLPLTGPRPGQLPSL